MTTEPLRPELEPLPPRMTALKVARGYPVPWFVSWVDGAPEFRCMDAPKWSRAIKEKLCWVCGEKLGKHMTFVAGPMCGINRISSEPPCHHDCAQWSARNCPFLSKPQMVRRENDMPEGKRTSPTMIPRNPGVTMLWTTKTYHLFRHADEVLIRMGEAERVEWWALGKPATRAQVDESVEAGLPKLREMNPDATEADLTALKVAFEKVLPPIAQRELAHAH